MPNRLAWLNQKRFWNHVLHAAILTTALEWSSLSSNTTKIAVWAMAIVIAFPAMVPSLPSYIKHIHQRSPKWLPVLIVAMLLVTASPVCDAAPTDGKVAHLCIVMLYTMN